MEESTASPHGRSRSLSSIAPDIHFSTAPNHL
jgi:hypothetical protein